MTNLPALTLAAAAASLLLATAPAPAPEPTWVRSSGSGRWSDPSTWERGRVPEAGDRVQVRAGHVVTLDLMVDRPIRSVHVAGTLRFDPDRDTGLTVGLLAIRPGDEPRESGFDDQSTAPHRSGDGPRPALEVGTAAHPISPGRSARLRLAMVQGLDPETCPALVCDGGRIDLQGAPVNRAWVKLGAPAQPGDRTLTLAEPVSGWRPGDRLIVTATHIPHVRNDDAIEPVGRRSETEERWVRLVEGTRLELDAPLTFAHDGEGELRGEVALLSHNVVVESADPSPTGVRGHTMIHAGSSASIASAEFRHLGKSGRLGKYSLHFHRAGDSMRGSSVVGTSIWDSGNRWLTIHGTNRLLIRDCVGYQSVGHGFFLEDGTEVDNVLDGNLAVQARGGKPLPDQVLPFDRNEGAGFWWANCGNAFTRNVAVECEAYGFRFDMAATAGFDPVRNVRGVDGKRRAVDVRTVPFLRFEANEAHTQRHHGFNLGGAPEGAARPGVGRVGPDERHPFVIKDLRVWETRWGFTPASPCVLVDGCTLSRCDFGFWRPVYDRHAYQGIRMSRNQWGYFHETGDRLTGLAFPAPLRPVDDRPPTTLVTRLEPGPGGRLVVSGVAVDNVGVAVVRVNGRSADRSGTTLTDWRIEFSDLPAGPFPLTAASEDAAGNIEATSHRLTAVIP